MEVWREVLTDCERWRPHRLRLQTPRVKSSHTQPLPLRGLPSATPLQPFPLSGPSSAASPRVSLHWPSLNPFPSAIAPPRPCSSLPLNALPSAASPPGALPSAIPGLFPQHCHHHPRGLSSSRSSRSSPLSHDPPGLSRHHLPPRAPPLGTTSLRVLPSLPPTAAGPLLRGWSVRTAPRLAPPPRRGGPAGRPAPCPPGAG